MVEGIIEAFWYKPGVYKYKIAGRGWTLIENGEVLIGGVDWVHWEASRSYLYCNDDEYTLIENGEVLIDGADYVHWEASRISLYRKDGKYTLIKNGKVLIDNVDYAYCYKEGVCRYEKDDKHFEVKDGITTEISQLKYITELK